MTLQTINIQLPDTIYQRLQRMADAMNLRMLFLLDMNQNGLDREVISLFVFPAPHPGQGEGAKIY